MGTLKIKGEINKYLEKNDFADFFLIQGITIKFDQWEYVHKQKVIT